MTALTAEEMAALWLPLMSVPALGLSVRGQAEFVEGTVVGESGHAADSEVDVHDWGQNRTVVLPRIRATMNLADASTRDRVARWLAGRVGLTLGSTGPDWGWCPPVMTWRLTAERGEWDAPQSLFDATFWDVHLGDTRRLHDGSGYCDALALGMAAVHLGGRS